MVDNNTIMKNGRCIECGARETDGFSCYEMFQFPLIWEHNDPELYDLHFWLVASYMIQHPSNYTKNAYKLMVELFIDAYDNQWSTDYILRKNRQLVSKIDKITNPLPNIERKRQYRNWPMTIEGIYLGGEENAINNIKEWRKHVRIDLQNNGVFKLI